MSSTRNVAMNKGLVVGRNTTLSDNATTVHLGPSIRQRALYVHARREGERARAREGGKERDRATEREKEEEEGEDLLTVNKE